MEILFNKNGKILTLVPATYIQKGNHNVDKVVVAIKDFSTSDYSVVANFRLPNGDTNSLVVTATETLLGSPAYSFYLTNDQTLYAGKVLMDISFVGLNSSLFTYSTELVINDTPFDPDATSITYSQYNNLVSALNSKIRDTSAKTRYDVHTDCRIRFKSNGKLFAHKIYTSETKPTSDVYLANGYPSGDVGHKYSSGGRKPRFEYSKQDFVHQRKRYGRSTIDKDSIDVLGLMELQLSDGGVEYIEGLNEAYLRDLTCLAGVDTLKYAGDKLFGFRATLNFPISDFTEEISSGFTVAHAIFEYWHCNVEDYPDDPTLPTRHYHFMKKVYLCNRFVRKNSTTGNKHYGCSKVFNAYKLNCVLAVNENDSTKTDITVWFGNVFR